MKRITRRTMASLLRATVKRILAHGWRGNGVMVGEAMCVGNHFCHLQSTFQNRFNLWPIFTSLFPGGSATYWNDNMCKSQEEAVKKLRDLAYACEHGGKDRKGNIIPEVTEAFS